MSETIVFFMKNAGIPSGVLEILFFISLQAALISEGVISKFGI